jgi:hypothetical protein
MGFVPVPFGFDGGRHAGLWQICQNRLEELAGVNGTGMLGILAASGASDGSVHL